MSHFGSTLDPDGVVIVSLALAADVETRCGANVSTDVNALCRLAEAYLRAQISFARGETAQLDLPFIAATPAGPSRPRRPVLRR